MYRGGYQSQWSVAKDQYDESKKWAGSKVDSALEWIEF